MDDENPTWSPDGKWILFSTRRDGNDTFALYVMRPDGSQPARVLTTTAWDVEADWGP
jgi:Tol biopolymer transport system component